MRKTRVEDVFFSGVFVAGCAIDRDHRLAMRRAVSVEFLVAVDAVQGVVNGFRRDFSVDEERHLEARLLHRERLIAMAFEAGRAGVGCGCGDGFRSRCRLGAVEHTTG